MAIAQKWIGKGYNSALILDFVGLSSSTYYYRLSTGNTDKRKNGNNKTGRPPKGYSINQEGKKIPDEQIEEFIMEIIEGEGRAYGYRKINACLRDEYGLKINHKKTYRLCKKLGVLRPQRKKKGKKPKKVARRAKVDAPDQLWQMDVKYGYISGEDRFFFQLSLLDVYTREVLDYHLGLACTAQDACRVVDGALKKRKRKKETTYEADYNCEIMIP